MPANRRFSMAIVPARDGLLGVALVDVSTGEFSTTEYHGHRGLPGADRRDRRAAARARSWCAMTRTLVSAFPELARLQLPVTNAEGWTFDGETARRALLDQLKTHGLEGFGLGAGPPRSRQPAASSRICATRRKPTSCTSAPSAIARAPIA